MRSPSRAASAEATRPLDPFFAGGALGLVQAMGYTFIALQGFDLIAAVGGEVRDPARNLPRSMYLSLGIALVIYLPLLLPRLHGRGRAGRGRSPTSRPRNPEGVVALAAERFLGVTGYWLVLVAGRPLDAERAPGQPARGLARRVRDGARPHAAARARPDARGERHAGRGDRRHGARRSRS